MPTSVLPSASLAQVEADYSSQTFSKRKEKPLLSPPKTGAFALYYMITKIGIESDCMSNSSYKKEMEDLDSETQVTHQKRLAELAEALKQEQSTKRWDVSTKIFSWTTSFSGLFTGGALIATGAGAIAGALLIAGSVIQISNQIMDVSKGWEKIAEKLPGETPEEKRSQVTWLQLGVTVFSLCLGGAGTLYGGLTNLTNLSTAYQSVSSLSQGVLAMGSGTVTIGSAMALGDQADKKASLAEFDVKLALLKHVRKDLMEKVEGSVDRLEQLFEALNSALQHEQELFHADQIIYRG